MECRNHISCLDSERTLNRGDAKEVEFEETEASSF